MLLDKQISNTIFAYLDLKEDIMFEHITDLNSYIKESFWIAEQAASRFEQVDFETLLCKFNVQIRLQEHDFNDSFSQIQSQIIYKNKHKCIDLYLPCIREKKEALNHFGYAISLEELLHIHLAHEFYHFYEFEFKKHTEELLPAVSYRFLGMFSQKAFVRKCSEVSAHRFAQLICHTSIHPKLMDYYYYIYKNMYTTEKVNDILEQADNYLKEHTNERSGLSKTWN